MSYVRVDSSVPRNRKFVQAGPAPSWLWLCGLAYCQEGLTDGFIPTEAIDYLGVKNARRLAEHLVRARLWDVTDGGWHVHDYLEHNKPASEIRRVNKARAEGGYLGGRPHKTFEATLEVNHTENPSVSVSTSVSESVATATSDPESAASFDATPPVLTFRTIGKGPKTWELTAGQVAAWSEAYPGVDIVQQCRRAQAWTDQNGYKTAAGMGRFLVRWLNREVDRHGSAPMKATGTEGRGRTGAPPRGKYDGIEV